MCRVTSFKACYCKFKMSHEFKRDPAKKVNHYPKKDMLKYKI